MSSHLALIDSLRQILPPQRVLDDDLSLTALATDASFYRLRPRLIIDVQNEKELGSALFLCTQHRVPVTFRAAGTSLSGQAQGEGALIRFHHGFRQVKVSANGEYISLGAAVIGSTANRFLKKYNRKIGPDPASIHSCFVGGIAANNASGMCCGTDQNTYRTLKSMKMVLPPRNLGMPPIFLDTADAVSVSAFHHQFPDLIKGIEGLRDLVLQNTSLKQLIIEKYKIKNTMGYSLNSFVDHQDPIEILQHLMIGSEGTLGFISEITYNTVVDHPIKACALVYFKTLGGACRAATRLKSLPIAAAELMDRTSLKSVQDKPGMPEGLDRLPNAVAALLIETRASSQMILQEQIELILTTLKEFDLFEPAAFSIDLKQMDSWWNIRRGLFPAVGRGRPAGTTVIIEDIAFQGKDLEAGTLELVEILKRNGYGTAILFGHVLDGNLHFSFAQDFRNPAAVRQYAKMMHEVSDLVATKFKGSLKAEHGTGRNMAPFVELEWGSEAYKVMTALKSLIDPLRILNPGVLLNENQNVHLENIKQIPAVNPQIDECIECGFCEVQCPSKNLTMTPRQRIAAFREIERLEHSDQKANYRGLFQYPGVDTCAADGLCSTVCPVGIDTGKYIKHYRHQQTHGQRTARALAEFIGRQFSSVLGILRFSLRLLEILPRRLVVIIAQVPGLEMLKFLPRAAKTLRKVRAQSPDQNAKAIVYFPSCISRTMGPGYDDLQPQSLMETHLRLFAKAGLRVIVPKQIKDQCCGLPFESKGFTEVADSKSLELEKLLDEASDHGRFPIVCDTSPCTARMLKRMSRHLKIYDSAQYVIEVLLDSQQPRIKLQKDSQQIALHITCSSRTMGIDHQIRSLAEACSDQIFVPEDVACCGFAGDKGFVHPELNQSAVAPLRNQIHGRVDCGVSNSRTCEIGLSHNTGVTYRALIQEVERRASAASPN